MGSPSPLHRSGFFAQKEGAAGLIMGGGSSCIGIVAVVVVYSVGTFLTHRKLMKFPPSQLIYCAVSRLVIVILVLVFD